MEHDGKLIKYVLGIFGYFSQKNTIREYTCIYMTIKVSSGEVPVGRTIKYIIILN